MTTSSIPSNDHHGAPGTFWGFLGAPMAGNASVAAGFMHWLAIAFKWFLRLILLLLAVGVVLGLGSLIFGSLPFHIIRRGGDGKSKLPADNGDTAPSADLIELEFLAADHDIGDGLISDDDDNEI